MQKSGSSRQQKTRETGESANGNSANGRKRALSDNFFRVWAPTLITALFIITFNVQAFEIPSESMEQTLLVGDHVLVDRVRFAPASGYLHGLEPYRPLQHGDIIVFMSPAQEGLHLVKRVMGLPGDRLKLVNKVVYRNGVPLVEPYVIHSVNDYEPARDDWPDGGPLGGVPQYWTENRDRYIKNGEIVVPPHSYFAMGDNRDVSFDSRYWGFVPEQNLIGRPLLVYWSYRTSGPEPTEPPALADRLKSLIEVLVTFPTRTRWSRTLHRVQ